MTPRRRLALLAPLLLSSCLVYKDLRQPPGGPASEAAWFYAGLEVGDFARLDGRRAPITALSEMTTYCISPGPHTVKVTGHGQQTLHFQAEPGQYYNLRTGNISSSQISYKTTVKSYSYHIERSQYWTAQRHQEASSKLDLPP